MTIRQNALASILSLLLCSTVGAAMAPVPADAAAHANRIHAKLSAAENAWIQQEAARESRANTVSEAVAAQAVRSGSGLDLTKMSVEDAVLLIMVTISEDARRDTRDIASDMEQTLKRKRAMRGQKAMQAEQTIALKNSARSEMAALGDAAAPAPARLASRPMAMVPLSKPTTEISGEMSQEQQLKMQMAMDRMGKADAVASNLIKKISRTQSGIVRNMK